MGYFKNQLIAQQVELGDRVPAPIPASRHVSNQHGLVSRRWLRQLEREHRDHHRTQAVVIGAFALAGGLLFGFFLGWVF